MSRDLGHLMDEWFFKIINEVLKKNKIEIPHEMYLLINLE
jgi:hypothetical protein